MRNPKTKVYLYGFFSFDNEAGVMPVYTARRKVSDRDVEDTTMTLDGKAIKRKHSALLFLNTTPTSKEVEALRNNRLFRRKQ